MHAERVLKAIALVTACTLSGTTAHAGVIFSDFNAGAYAPGFADGVRGPSTGFPQSVAAAFTSSGNYSVDRIDLGLTNSSGTNSAVVDLWTNSFGIPGVLLGSWTVSDQPLFGSTTSVLTTITGIAGVNLISGDTYFLSVFPGGSDTADEWNRNTSGASGVVDFEFAAPVWFTFGQTLPAFDILGTAVGVPEPTTLTLFGFGLLGLGAIRRRRNSRGQSK